MKFKVKETTILSDGKKYPEGSTIELSKEESIRLNKYLIPIETPEGMPSVPESPEGPEGLTDENTKKSKKGDK